MFMYRKIIVGYDGSEGSRAALIQALKLAKELGAEVSALWVRGKLPHYPETIDEVEEEKEAADVFFSKLKEETAAISSEHAMSIEMHSESGHQAKTIIDYANKTQCDLIVLGHSGHSSIWGNLLGHTTQKVSENAHCSVLIVR
jgi:nucleotide-binding universal stress UspA family protein